jgi:hypothetical protein
MKIVPPSKGGLDEHERVRVPGAHLMAHQEKQKCGTVRRGAVQLSHVKKAPCLLLPAVWLCGDRETVPQKPPGRLPLLKELDRSPGNAGLAVADVDGLANVYAAAVHQIGARLA